jgi:hypothetical protein
MILVIYAVSSNILWLGTSIAYLSLERPEANNAIRAGCEKTHLLTAIHFHRFTGCHIQQPEGLYRKIVSGRVKNLEFQWGLTKEAKGDIALIGFVVMGQNLIR